MLELTLKREELLSGLAQIQSIVEKRSSMPVLSNVLLEAQAGQLAMTATDLEITFRGIYQGEVAMEGRLTIPARKFYEIVRVLGDEKLKIKETENHGLILTGSRSTYQLHGLAPEDFPAMPQHEEVRFLTIEAGLLGDMVEKTIYSLAAEETRYNLAGVYFEKGELGEKSLLRLVSTDGHRLSFVEKEVGDLAALDLPKGVIISRKGLNEIRKLADSSDSLQLGFTPKTAVVKAEGKVMVMRLLEGRFPDYQVVIPKKNDRLMTVGRKDFLEVLRRVSVISSEDYKGVKFGLGPKELVLTAVNPDLGEARESLPVDYEGPSLEIGFNPRYFIEALSALKSDQVTVAFHVEGHPCKITGPEDQGYIGVVMPMKI